MHHPGGDSHWVGGGIGPHGPASRPLATCCPASQSPDCPCPRLTPSAQPLQCCQPNCPAGPLCPRCPDPASSGSPAPPAEGQTPTHLGSPSFGVPNASSPLSPTSAHASLGWSWAPETLCYLRCLVPTAQSCPQAPPLTLTPATPSLSLPGPARPPGATWLPSSGPLQPRSDPWPLPASVFSSVKGDPATDLSERAHGLTKRPGVGGTGRPARVLPTAGRRPCPPAWLSASPDPPPRGKH